ncbi:MAG: hypothetical protein IPL76_02420 [Gemmatimonadetes bacterium]|nr:hypothetical protein [Gemmatimonadota bacterium]MBK9691748.1 hypothetical protein [Gemmatimonadota bacterium]
MRRMLVAGTCLTFGALLGGCSRFAPDDAERFEPPAVYHAWWSQTEQCSGRTGNIARVQWFKVPGHAFECPTGSCAGRWEDNHSIYVAEDWLEHEMVVRHEMLHELLNGSGHPDPPFGDPCPLTWSTWSGSAGELRQEGTLPGLD